MRTKVYNGFDNQELVWFFNQAESDMGYSSNYSTFMYLMEGGISSNHFDPEDQITDKHINAATKYRRISNKLIQLSKREQYILECYFTFYAKRHPVLHLIFDDALPVMLLDYTPNQLADIIKKKQQAKDLKDEYRKEVKQCLISYQKLICH